MVKSWQKLSSPNKNLKKFKVSPRKKLEFCYIGNGLFLSFKHSGNHLQLSWAWTMVHVAHVLYCFSTTNTLQMTITTYYEFSFPLSAVKTNNISMKLTSDLTDCNSSHFTTTQIAIRLKTNFDYFLPTNAGCTSFCNPRHSKSYKSHTCFLYSRFHIPIRWV